MDPGARIESVELRVGDLERARRYYGDVLGLEHLGDEPLAMGAGGRALIVLREAEPGTPAPPDSTGLFHVAIRHPDRVELGRALRRLIERGTRLTGASEHGVSQALYLRDPDWNGIELYFDRPPAEWPREPDGSFAMVSVPLDLEDLLRAAGAGDGGPVDPRTDVGHVHLQVADVDRSVGFYRDDLGLNLHQRMGDQAAFLAAGDYHHHVGVNTWNSRGGGPPPPGSAGLERFTIALPSPSILGETAERLGGTELRDPDGIAIRLVAPQ